MGESHGWNRLTGLRKTAHSCQEPQEDPKLHRSSGLEGRGGGTCSHLTGKVKTPGLTCPRQGRCVCVHTKASYLKIKPKIICLL